MEQPAARGVSSLFGGVTGPVTSPGEERRQRRSKQDRCGRLGWPDGVGRNRSKSGRVRERERERRERREKGEREMVWASKPVNPLKTQL
ncbi:hypothetical protein ACLB2K_021784 [Fragaria x ananassa]